MAAGDLTTLANVKAWLGMQGVAITAITKANPGVVSAPNHNLKPGLPILITGALGMTQINGVPVMVTVIDQNLFSVGIDTSAFGVYTGGGFAGQDDVVLTRLITACSGWISAYCSRNFAVATYDEFYDGGGNSKQVLRNYPIISIQSMTLDGTVSVPASPAPLASGYANSDIEVYARGQYSFPRGFQNVRIQYTAGFAVIPPDLEQSAIGLVAWRYRESKRIGMTAESLGGQITTSFAIKDMPPDALTNLQQYKKSVAV